MSSVRRDQAVCCLLEFSPVGHVDGRPLDQMECARYEFGGRSNQVGMGHDRDRCFLVCAVLPAHILLPFLAAYGTSGMDRSTARTNAHTREPTSAAASKQKGETKSANGASANSEDPAKEAIYDDMFAGPLTLPRSILILPQNPKSCL
jgi:hypothetical protein